MADAKDAARMLAIGRRIESYSVVVRWIPGWETRGGTWSRTPVGVWDHHDASSIKSGEWGSLGYIVDGSPIAPLAQFQVARCLDNVPKVAIVAAGRCNHGGLGGPLDIGGVVIPQDQANAYVYGSEKANDGLGEFMNEAFHYATDATFHAVLEVCG